MLTEDADPTGSSNQCSSAFGFYHLTLMMVLPETPALSHNVLHVLTLYAVCLGP